MGKMITGLSDHIFHVNNMEASSSFLFVFLNIMFSSDSKKACNKNLSVTEKTVIIFLLMLHLCAYMFWKQLN